MQLAPLIYSYLNLIRQITTVNSKCSTYLIKGCKFRAVGGALGGNRLLEILLPHLGTISISTCTLHKVVDCGRQ